MLIIRTDPKAVWGIPKVKGVDSFAQHLKTWTKVGIMSMFILRNVFSRQLEFDVSNQTMAIDPRCPLVFSPENTAFSINTRPLPPAMENLPKLSLVINKNLTRWYNKLYENIVAKTLFRASSRATSVATNAGNTVDSNENSDDENFGGCQPHPSQSAKPTSSLAIDIYVPPILEKPDCPKLYKTFWSLKAFPRQLTAVKGNTSEGDKFVAPKYPVKMLEVANHINLPNLLASEFESYAKVYQAIVNERNYCSVDNKGSDVHISIINEASVLALLGKGKILDDLKKNSPTLREQRLDQLTEAELQSFFFQARTYLLNNAAPYWSFPDYFLSTKTLGADIFNKVTEILLGYPTYKSTLRQFSSFIEHSIRQILPIQESYTNSEERIIENHRSYLLAPLPSADHTKISLQADAQELLIKSPYYKQNQSTITEEFKRKLIEMEKSNLLYKIISNTHYEKDLIQLLIANDNYPSLDKVPYGVIVTNLENLILVNQKAESIEVNMAKSGPVRSSRSPQPKQRGIIQKSPSRGERTMSSRSPQSPRSTGRKSVSRTRPGMQEACDICLLHGFDTQWCRQENHCRQPGHQPSTSRSQTREKQIRAGDLSCFVLYHKCTKCFPQLVNMSSRSVPGVWPMPPSIPQQFYTPPPPHHSNNHLSHQSRHSEAQTSRTFHGEPHQQSARLFDPSQTRNPPPQFRPNSQRPPSRSPSRYQSNARIPPPR